MNIKTLHYSVLFFGLVILSYVTPSFWEQAVFLLLALTSLCLQVKVSD